MDDNEDGNKVRQYWNYVFNAGCSLFSNPNTSAGLLQDFVNIVLGTKLFAQIECLSEDNSDDDYPFPMTGWLLENIFTAIDGDESQTFLIDAYIKLLEGSYERNVCEYLQLTKLHINVIDKLLKAKAHAPISILNDINRPVINAFIPPVYFTVKSEIHRMRSLNVLCKIIHGTIDCYFDCCNSEDGIYFVSRLKSIFVCCDAELMLLLLPLLKSSCLNTLNENCNEIFRDILLSLIAVLPAEQLNNQQLKDTFLDVWHFLKNRVNLSPMYLKYVIDKLIESRSSCFCEDFVLQELGSLLNLLSFNQVNSYLERSNWSLYDRTYLLEHLIIKEISTFLSDTTLHIPPANGSAPAKSISRYWSEILTAAVEVATHGTVVFGRIKMISATVSVITRILAAVTKIHANADKKLLFFDDVSIILKCVIDHLEASPEINALAIDTLVGLLNLPESLSLSADVLKQPLGIIVQITNSNTVTSSSKAKLLECLQNVPYGMEPSDCLVIYSSTVTGMTCQLEPALQAIRSAPFLCMTGRISCCQVIAEILVPAMLSEKEECQLVALESASKMTCIFTGVAYIARNSFGKCDIKCKDCSTPGEVSSGCGQIESHLLKLIDIALSGPPAVRRKLLAVFPPISRHLGPGIVKHSVTLRLIALLGDPDMNVRYDFSKTVTSIIFGQISVDLGRNLLKNYLVPLEYFHKRVEDYINAGNIEQWSDEMNALAHSLVEVACFPDEVVLLPTLKLLLRLSHVCPVPMSYLTCSIAAAHNTSSMILYHKYRPELSQMVGKLVVENYEFYQSSVAITMTNLSDFFNDLSKKRFIAGCEPDVLIALIASAATKPTLIKLVSDYAEFAEESLPTIVTKYFQYIYVHLYLTENESTFTIAMSLIDESVGLKTSSLVSHCLKSIIHQLLFNYHRDETKVLNGLKQVLDINSYSYHKEMIATSLESRFVGYLLFIVSKFTKEDSPDSDKVKSLESLAAVLNLMGMKRITPVARKVLATLQSALSGDKHWALQCKAWDAFVRNVNCGTLAPLLPTIVASLLPMLDHAKTEVVTVLSYLLVEQRSAMDDYLQYITFLPEHEALKQISSSISGYITPHSDIRMRLSRETELARHETVGVRLAGLKALRSTLKKFSIEITSLINECDTPDVSVLSLWEALLICCRDNNEDIAVAAAACVGELGAIDPALLPRRLKPTNKLPLTVHDPEFGYLALCEIVRGFHNARTSVDMDAFAIGIQEIFKIFDVKDEDDNQIWIRFSASEQSLMRPMFSSRYKVQIALRAHWPKVIFGSQDASTHLRWAALWAGKLISSCADEKAVVLFRACEPSFKRDARVLQFFLQYIVLYILTQDASHHQDILSEMMAVLSWSAPDSSNDTSLPLRLMESSGYPLIRSSLSEADVRDSAMTVCLIIDFLQYWSRLYLTKHVTPTASQLKSKDYISIKEFLAKIDLVKMADMNFDIKEYPRAIQYWEDLSRDNDVTLMKHLPMLSKAYARFGDLDSVAGARAMTHSTLDINDQIFYHQVSRQLEEARILYEQLMKNGDLMANQVESLVTCYLRLGEPSTASSLIQKYIKKSPEMAAILNDTKSECLLQLGDWTQIDSFFKDDMGQRGGSWNTEILRICELQNDSDIKTAVKAIRSALSGNFAALGCHATADNHDYATVVKLHILNNIEAIAHLINYSDSSVPMETLLAKKIQEWEAKDCLVQANSDFYEQILSTRRFFLGTLSKKKPEVQTLVNQTLGKYWVASAEAARKAGCLHQAYNYILCAEPYNIPQTFIEKAQLFWDKGRKEESLLTLTRGIATYFPDAETMKLLPHERLDERKMAAQAKLLYAVYNEETSNCTINSNMVNYQAAYEVCRQLEKTQVLLAQCFDRALFHMDERETDGIKACELRVTMLCHFGKSLSNGCEYIYQSVPRLLSVWLDLGENLTSDEHYKAMRKSNKLIQTFSEKLPPFILMTALPQLLSRIGHSNREVFLILKSIIVKLTLAFPQQCLWAMQTVSKSSVPERSARYKEVVSDGALRSTILKLIEDFSVLGDKLNSLTNKNLPQDSVVKGLLVSNVVRELPLLLESDKFSRIIIPITKFCSITLPKNVTSTTHQPFMKEPATIVGIKKEMTVLPSLQRPRKITLIGSDGVFYEILCKPKDDLRRDARLMEFNNIVNMYLHRDPDSRARHLHIRTYVVTPLGECGGLLEWVPKLVGLRPALLQLYRERGKFVSARELRQHEVPVRESLAKKRTVFLEKLIPMHPPIFYEWFRRTFPDPAGWYEARQAYIRTTAVMSMVGYILGLGDRHGENILFDSESGDTIHVDFNCLFNKGEKLDYKERVPFRLTHNMAKAMGPCGVEGSFRKSCEISMRVLRAQDKTLMSVLTPFAYDPFGSWSKNKEITRPDCDRQISEALEELNDIEKRLKGSMRLNQKNNKFYLSVEGLVRALITDATKVDNLCQMYLGWGAYL